MGENSETNEHRKATGIIDIREEEISISGKEMFIEYITQGIQEELGAGCYGDNGIVLWVLGL